MANRSLERDSSLMRTLDFDLDFKVEPFDGAPNNTENTPYDGHNLFDWMAEVDAELNYLEGEEQSTSGAGHQGNNSTDTHVNHDLERFSYKSATTINQDRYLAKLREWRNKIAGFLTERTSERGKTHEGETSSPRTSPTFRDFRMSLQGPERRELDAALHRGSTANSRPNTAKIPEEEPEQGDAGDEEGD